MKPKIRTAAAGIAAIGLAAALWLPARAGGPVLATQKSRAFQPGSVTLALGEVLRIVNDDGPLLHHAYVRSDRFKFDSNEQQPGTTVDIAFPELGSYTVLCGIHPKMRLAVVIK